MRNSGAYPVWADFAWRYDYGTLPVLDAPNGTQIPSALVHMEPNWPGVWNDKGLVNGDCAWLIPHENRVAVYGCGANDMLNQVPRHRGITSGGFRRRQGA